ncbi:MAG: acyl carrier protein [Eubacterium sp.]|nr:acyl carrier protein [Eubacterium sp.]MBQ9022401.1 acyl carrier protein [Eubacterium sp.]
MEELMEILEELRPDVDFEEEKGLIADGILDSFDIMSLVGSIDEEFDIKIKPNDLIPDNFNSAEAIWALVERLMEE